jgi:hypothetical protein
MLLDVEASQPEAVLFFKGHPTKAGWKKIRSDADDFLRGNGAILDVFRDRLTPLFDSMRADKEPFKRRPNISLRLIAAGDPPAKVITLPGARFGRDGGCLIPSSHHVELLEQKEIKARHHGEEKDALQFSKKLSFANASDFPPTVGTVYKSAVEDARRVIETIRDFLDDSRAVLARGCDHCCICGRSLTDELSRSRGIGPECIRKADIVAALIGPEGSGFIVPETTH